MWRKIPLVMKALCCRLPGMREGGGGSYCFCGDCSELNLSVRTFHLPQLSLNLTGSFSAPARAQLIQDQMGERVHFHPWWVGDCCSVYLAVFPPLFGPRRYATGIARAEGCNLSLSLGHFKKLWRWWHGGGLAKIPPACLESLWVAVMAPIMVH